LTAVVGFLELMNDPESGLTLKEHTELIAITHREATRMSRIVADVILLTRFAPDKISLVEESISVSSLIGETLRTIDPDGAEIEIMVSDDLAANFDRGRLQQVLINLVENAIRYGDGRIAVVAQNRNGDLVLEVHDNGPGVPKRDRHIMWQRFERGANRFNTAIPGSGVGLAVVAAIAASHGGQASYEESDILGGACFRITLPDRCRDAKTSALRAALQTA